MSNFKRIERIKKQEADFIAEGFKSNGKYELAPFSIPIPGDAQRLHACWYTPPRSSSRKKYFDKDVIKKDKIVLHFTAGTLAGDIPALTGNREMVSTAFVIARTGLIISLFNSKYWAYHLGSHARGGNGRLSPKSIAIELSNYGPLSLDPAQNLHTAYSNPNANKSDIYCSIHDKGEFISIDESFRGASYFANFTDAQYESLILLLRYLTAHYNIPATFLEEDKRYKLFPDSASARAFKGITSHINHMSPDITWTSNGRTRRGSQKWDIGPAFDWKRVIDGVKAASYTPSLKHEIANAEAFASEDEAERNLTVGTRDIISSRSMEQILEAYGEEGEQFYEGMEEPKMTLGIPTPEPASELASATPEKEETSLWQTIVKMWNSMFGKS